MIHGKSSKLVEAACFYANLLGIADYEFDLEIREKKIKDGRIGVCRYMKIDDEHHFIIDLEKSKKRREGANKYETLAHEMVHVKQYVTGQLQDNGNITEWTDGQNTRIFFEEEDNEDSYWDSPWEIEAFGRQVGLYHRWIKHQNLKD